MLSVLALGMLIAVGAAIGGAPYAEQNYVQPHNGGDGRNNDGNYDHGGNHNFDGFNNHYDWLNTGGYYPYDFYQTYPYSYYPTNTYTYPTYTYPAYTYPTYTAPVVYNPYPYDPAAYDPWYATNVYGWGGATYYYSSSWSWSSHHGGFFY
jgi:hypothetical protein